MALKTWTAARCLLALAGMLAVASPALSKPVKKAAKASHAAIPAKPGKVVPLPRSRPTLAAPARAIEPTAARPLALTPASVRPVAPAVVASAAATLPLAMAATSATSAADLAAVKQAIGLARRGRASDATDVQQRITDPLARKLVEWAILRSDDNQAEFARYAAFIAANPGWPSLGMLRRRAEAMLWHERSDAARVRAFTGPEPLSAKGRLALARALLAQGDRAGAQANVRAAWRLEDFSSELESQVREMFGDLITRADDKARMDRRLYSQDHETAMRAAQRLGGAEPAIARARAAVNNKAGNAKVLLEAVPTSAQNDAGYIFSRIQWLRRNEQVEDAARLMLAAPRDPAQLHDLDEWWIERRLITRKLLDMDEPRAAYQVARDAAPPTKENYRVEHEFTAGWIALRFLKDAATAAQHFARIDGTANPIALARAGYWKGRAAEAANKSSEARAHYQAAARYSTAYYGQLARGRLGLGEIVVSPPPVLSAEKRAALARLEVVRAAELLYAVDQRDLVLPFVIDVADKSNEVGALVLLGELAGKHNDARAMLFIGKTALARGLPFDHFAFPTIGLPRYSAIGPEVEPTVVYSIARQESAFNPRTVSSANALGLMQVTPDAGRYIAKKFNVKYDQKRLLHDNVYNVQMGSAELGDVLERYRGSYILAFVAYNAGPGRAKDWIARYGDPRDPEVDPVDWVERIPFSETRNYVQRILENLQVYRARFGGGSRLLIEADIRRGTLAN